MDHPKIRLLIDLGTNKLKQGLSKARQLVNTATGGMKSKLAELEMPAINTGKFKASLGGIKSMIVAAGIGAALGSSISTAFEGVQAKTSFEVLAGDKPGDQLYDDLTRFAQDSIFGNEVYQNSQMMLGYGENVKDVMPDLKMLGDISMGSKDKLQQLDLAFMQVQASGRLMGQEVLQLVNAGFNPLAQISQTTGKSMATLKKEMEDGKISFAMVKKAFKDATSEGGRFYKMTERIADTPFGKWEALKGQVQGVSLAFGTALLPAVSSLLTIAAPMLQQFGSGIQAVTPFITGLVNGFIAILPVIREIAQPVREIFSGITAALQDVQFTDIIGGILSFAKTVSDTLMPIFNELSPIVSTLFSVLSDVAMDTINELSNSFTVLAPALLDIAKILGNILVPAIKIAGTLFKWATGLIGGLLNTIIRILKPFLSALTWFSEAIGNFMDRIAEIIGSKTENIQDEITDKLKSQRMLDEMAAAGKLAGESYAHTFKDIAEEAMRDLAPKNGKALESFRQAAFQLDEVTIKGGKPHDLLWKTIDPSSKENLNFFPKYIKALGESQGKEAFDNYTNERLRIASDFDKMHGTKTLKVYQDMVAKATKEITEDAYNMYDDAGNETGKKTPKEVIAANDAGKVVGSAQATKTVNVHFDAYIKGDVITQNKSIQNMSKDEFSRWLQENYQRAIHALDNYN